MLDLVQSLGVCLTAVALLLICRILKVQRETGETRDNLAEIRETIIQERFAILEMKVREMGRE
jgi:cell division protein FtsL